MLQITIPAGEQWDEEKQEFLVTKKQILTLEHSLVSLSKWESKWRKPFLSKTPKTREEELDYVKCMTITQNVDPAVYNFITNENMKQINEYIDSPMTAAWFSEEEKRKHSNEQITSETIYYWMIALNIPFECQKWHLNRLLTLIRFCNAKNTPPKKKSMRDIMSRNAAINAANKKKYNTKG